MQTYRHAAFLVLVGVLCASSTSAQLIIGEFRVRGPAGAQDEYVEVFNNSGASHVVTASSGGGYGVAASDGTLRCTIPNGTVVPARGHYLCVNSATYSLGAYPAGNGTTATGDATFTTDIPDNAGIALFNTNTPADFNLANRLDAVGSTTEANTLYKEGTGYPQLTPFSIDYAFHRDECGKQGSITNIGPCPTGGAMVDTDNNAVDFIFVDTNGTSAGAGQRLGSPGPENLSSPTSGSSITVVPLDATVSNFLPPNQVRDFTSDPANNSTFGTISVRRRFVNDTGASVTRLRFRVIDQSTFPAPSGFADLRTRTSVAVVIGGVNDAATCAATGAPATPPCTITASGTTLEQPPSQPNGGAFNGSYSAGTVTLATPLANGASINLQFFVGLQQTGIFKLGLQVEALPGGGATGGLLLVSTCTDGCPLVTSIVRADPDPTLAQTVNYTVTFSESVTGVNAADFALTTTGTIAGATVSNVAGTGAIYTVTVDRGTGSGTVRLDVVDDDTIVDATPQPLGGTGAGNGNFTTGEVYTVLAAVTTFSGPSATGTGTVSASFTGGGGSCSFTGAQLIGAPPGVPPVPPVAPPTVPPTVFPHGLFAFSLGGCTPPGSIVAFTMTYPQTLPAGTQYFKYGPTTGDPTDHWYVLPAVVAGNTITFSITDGGLGDDDLAANGTIVDQGGPGETPGGTVAEIPTLDAKALAILVALLLAAGLLALRREHTPWRRRRQG